MDEPEVAFPWLPVDQSEPYWELQQIEPSELSLAPMELPELGHGDLSADQLLGLASATGTRLQSEDCLDDDHATMNLQCSDANRHECMAGVFTPSPSREMNIHHQPLILKVDKTSHGQYVSSTKTGEALASTNSEPLRIAVWKPGSRKTRHKRLSPWNLVCFAGSSLVHVVTKYTTRKCNKHWTEEEVELLVNGITEYGVGHWTEVRRKYFPKSVRTAVNLKDKWRNLRKAYDIKYKSRKGKVQKTTYLPLKQPLIKRIRELADKYRQDDEASLSDSSTITV
ncbi:hypothetical protein ACP70R_019184 [Stipagrostis hirtigluma subsp. patula]